MSPFLHSCDIQPPSVGDDSSSEIMLPQDLVQFWTHANSAKLFEDAEYGQWGLEILSPKDAQNESIKQYATRPQDFLESDLVVGRFLGDSDLLVIRNDSSACDYCQVLVALPIDKRRDWYVAANSFASFLEKFIELEGDKYWE